MGEGRGEGAHDHRTRIARRLGVTLKSVNTQIKRFYDKIGVRGRMGMLKKVYAERDRVRAERQAEGGG